jgi:hypothetical protein
MSRRDVGTELYIRAAATCSEKPGQTGNDPKEIAACYRAELACFLLGSFPQGVGDRCEKCTKTGRAPEENLVGLAGEQAFSSL